MEKKIVYIDHALAAIKERGIEADWVESAVKEPPLPRPTPHMPDDGLPFVGSRRLEADGLELSMKKTMTYALSPPFSIEE